MLEPPVEDVTFTPGSTVCFNAPFDLAPQTMTIKINNPSIATAMMFKLVPNLKDPVLKGSNALSCNPSSGVIFQSSSVAIAVTLNPFNIDSVTNLDNKITVQYVSAPPGVATLIEPHFNNFKTVKKAFITISFNK